MHLIERESKRRRPWAARLGAWFAVLAWATTAIAQTEEPAGAKIRRNTFSADATVMAGGLPPAGDIGGSYQYQRAVSPGLAWLAGLQARGIGMPIFGGETIVAFEGVGGARYFPGGRAPAGFHLGGLASVGVGHWTNRTSTLFGGEARTLDEGDDMTWSTVGQLGYQWISNGGFAFGLHLDAGAGTTSLQRRRSGIFAGFGSSIGGAW